MSVSTIIEQILSEWAYRVDDGMPNPKNPTHLKELGIVLSEMGLSHIKNELVENLLIEKGKTPEEVKEEEGTFKNPALNKKINYKNTKGEDTEGLVGNLLRLPKEHPGRQAAERTLPPEGSEERDSINKDLGGQNQPAKPEEPKGDKGGGEEAPKEDPIQKAAAMFDPKADPAMAQRMSKEKEVQAQIAKDAETQDKEAEKEVEPKAEDEFNPIASQDVQKEMPQADPQTFNAQTDIPDGVEQADLNKFNTDISKVQQMVADAKAKGEKAPNINLCDITVPGTNLYCDDNLGIPRSEMPQFKGTAQPGTRAADMPADASGEVDTEPVFREMLKEKGIKTSQTEVPADKLKATQSELVGAKVVGMMGALEKDPQHDKITAPIYVSRDGFVVDGHHRWAAVAAYNAKYPEKQIPMKVTVIDQDIKDVIPMANKFAEDMGIAAKKADANKEAPDSAPKQVSSIKPESFTDKIKSKLQKWTKSEKEYFEKGYYKAGSEPRRTVSQAIKDKASGAWKAVKDGFKHEVHEFKSAGQGVGKFFKGEKLNDHEKDALKSVAKKVVVTALMGAAMGGLSYGAVGFAKHVAIEFIPHVVGETILKGAGRAAIFADVDGEAEMDANMQKFIEMISQGLEDMEISQEQMEEMINSYEEKKANGEIETETPQMKEENLQLADELMLEMIYGFIEEATAITGDWKLAARKGGPDGKIVYFKSPESKKDALAAGTHIDVDKKLQAKGTQTKSEPVAGADLYGQDYKDARSDVKNTTTKKQKVVKYKQYNSESGVKDMEGPDGSSFEGYKDGKIKAPGTPAGAFNEVGGMKVAGYLRQNPNATDEELSKYLSEWAKTGKITKKPKVSGGDKLTAAVRTGRAVYERCNEIASEEGYDPATTKISGYWGSEQSKVNSIAQIQSIAKKNPKAKFNGYSVDEYIKIIEKNGAGENPTDVMLTIWDGKSDNVALFHVSNKIGSNNIQANSTVRKTYDRAVSIINNVFTNEAEKQAAMKSVEKRKANTLKLQKSQIEYQISFLDKFAAISKNEKALATLAKDIYSEEGSIRRGDEINKMFTSTGAIAKLCKKLAKPHPSCKLVDNPKATPSQKVKAMFDVYAANPNSAPSSVREIISRASTIKMESGKPKYNTGYNAEVINEIYGKMNDEVEGMRKDLNKIQAGSGDRLLAKDFADRLHLTLAEGHNPGGIPANRFSLVMGNNEADIWYDSNGQAYQKIKNAYHKVNDDGNLEKTPTPLKQNQVNRGNISTIGDAKNFKHCLNTPEGKKIEEAINVKYGKINTKTGIQTAHIFDIEGKNVGIMTIRTKSGPGGDANDTIQFSKEMQNCMQKQEYLKKKNK